MYSTPNYFQYRPWLYTAFINALVDRAGAKAGHYLLDAGCGQGFFSYLFAQRGINVVGMDASETGIATAKQTYRSPRLTFKVGDIRHLGCSNQFDYVFAR